MLQVQKQLRQISACPDHSHVRGPPARVRDSMRLLPGLPLPASVRYGVAVTCAKLVDRVEQLNHTQHTLSAYKSLYMLLSKAVSKFWCLSVRYVR